MVSHQPEDSIRVGATKFDWMYCGRAEYVVPVDERDNGVVIDCLDLHTLTWVSRVGDELDVGSDLPATQVKLNSSVLVGRYDQGRGVDDLSVRYLVSHLTLCRQVCDEMALCAA